MSGGRARNAYAERAFWLGRPQREERFESPGSSPPPTRELHHGAGGCQCACKPGRWRVSHGMGRHFDTATLAARDASGRGSAAAWPHAMAGADWLQSRCRAVTHVS